MTIIQEVPAEVVWPIRHRVMYPDNPPESVQLPEDAYGKHLALTYGEVVVSVVSLFQYGDQLQFRKFATQQDYQGKGFGSQLLRFVIQHARQENIKRIWCNARAGAAGFYRRLGFRETEETFFKDGFDFVVMELLC